ncbi:hypothetical protein AMTR_s00005p00043020, partial [Amborella trichopoda]
MLLLIVVKGEGGGPNLGMVASMTPISASLRVRAHTQDTIKGAFLRALHGPSRVFNPRGWGCLIRCSALYICWPCGSGLINACSLEEVVRFSLQIIATEDEIASLQTYTADVRVRQQQNREAMTKRSQRLRHLRFE